MIVFLWCIFLLAAVVRLSWWSFFRLTSPSSKASEVPLPAQGISIVICAHNNVTGLQQLLPALLQQVYPLFEIVVVNDRSTDATESWLTQQMQHISNLQLVTIQATPEDWNAKKYALREGIRHARYSWLALTDSDCLPFSNQWLHCIAQTLQEPEVSVFLGYSPYTAAPGILNKIIQTETLFTALQYFSFSYIGKTYMGVGRNLAYKKSFIEPYLDHFPFQQHMGGDDDLLISQLSTGKDAKACTLPESFVWTFPPTTWTAWWQQKRRHLSAGQRYNPFIRRLLGTYWMSASSFWLTFLLLLFCNSAQGNYLLLGILIFSFCAGTAILYPLFRIFKAGSVLRLFLFWDFLYIASSSIIGFSTFLVKNKKWS